MSLLDAVGWFRSALVGSLSAGACPAGPDHQHGRPHGGSSPSSALCVGICRWFAMNLVLTAINLWFIPAQTGHDRRSDTAYAVLQVAGDDTYLSNTSEGPRAPRSRAPPPCSADRQCERGIPRPEGSRDGGYRRRPDVSDGIPLAHRVGLRHATRFLISPPRRVRLSAVRALPCGHGFLHHRHAARDGRRLLRPARFHPQR